MSSVQRQRERWAHEMASCPGTKDQSKQGLTSQKLPPLSCKSALTQQTAWRQSKPQQIHPQDLLSISHRSVAWGRPPICSSLMPAQKLEMLLAGGLVFKGDSLFKKGTIGRKNPHGQTPRKALAWIVSITLALPRGAGNVTSRQLGPCVSFHLCNPVPHTVPGTPQALN